MDKGISNDSYRPSVTSLPLIQQPKPQVEPSRQLTPVVAGAATLDTYQPSSIVGKVAAAVDKAVETYNKVRLYIAGIAYDHILKPLSDNAQYLFAQVIPREIKMLALKWKSNTLTETERAQLNEYLAMNKIKNRFEFLNRIVSGDPTVAEDTPRQAKYHLFVSLAAVSPDGTIKQDGQTIDPQYAVVKGSQALVARDDNHNQITVTSLVTLREGTRKQIEDYTVVYIQRSKAHNILQAAPK